MSYKISHAGRSFGFYYTRWGFLQGDPLYSYLFLISIEGLTVLFHDSKRLRMIKGIKVSRTAPSNLHMFFVDDSYTFAKHKWRVLTMFAVVKDF